MTLVCSLQAGSLVICLCLPLFASLGHITCHCNSPTQSPRRLAVHNLITGVTPSTFPIRLIGGIFQHAKSREIISSVLYYFRLTSTQYACGICDFHLSGMTRLLEWQPAPPGVKGEDVNKAAWLITAVVSRWINICSTH